jgi:hypothetical protein
MRGVSFIQGHRASTFLRLNVLLELFEIPIIVKPHDFCLVQEHLGWLVDSAVRIGGLPFRLGV